MKIKFETSPNYCYLFNYLTGENITIEKHSVFARDLGPNLLDVSITSRCNKGCDFCYRRSNTVGTDISLENYKLILDNAKQCGVQQIALGGGEPTLHPYLCEILKMTREAGIVPNYSTNGENLTKRILLFSKEYCGALAISIYDDFSKYETLVNETTDLGIKLNLHLILRADRIEEYIHILKHPPIWISKINAIIFLNYKPANGNDSLCFKNCSSDTIKEFFASVAQFDACGVGFDTCSVSFVCNNLPVDNSLFDFCEAGRKSAYINEKLEVYPCSFYKYGSDSLKNESLKSIWHKSKIFKNHRDSLKVNDKKCENKNECCGGCPIYSINQCMECNVTPT